MRVALVTPYLASARNGNAHTAMRYARFLRSAGHQVDMILSWPPQDNPTLAEPDAMIALHARRSHTSISRFTQAFPKKPLILVLTGTDLYRDIQQDADARDSLEYATQIVVLQECGIDELPPHLQHKVRVIFQSAPTRKPVRKPRRTFDCCVVAHLRDEKDPFCAAKAAILLPADSRARVRHIGNDHIGDEWQMGMAKIAHDYEQGTTRWRWIGPLPHGKTRERIARSHLLIISSRMEGGANVIVEALCSGTPVLASDISGNRGMLGPDYSGYFPLGNSQALADLISRAENDPAFYAELARQCAARTYLFQPAREALAVQSLLA